MLRRLLPIALIVSVLGASVPAPASAMSTQSEIQLGKQADEQIVQQSGVIADPLENAWVNEIGKRLWAQAARKDLPYNIKIIDSPDINAFSTYGGYVYVNEGTLDFAQSDDELAGVIGHETGHLERRHAVNLQNNAGIVNLLLGVTSLFSPFVYRFGQLMQAGLVAKMQRGDEFEADKYGLFLMTRAGYDPDAMVTFMKHLNVQYGESHNLLDKYFADHPGGDSRVKAMLGQEEFTKRTPEQTLAQALHDQEEGRYAIAARRFTDVLRREPNNGPALFGLGQMQLALGQTSKGEQTLAQVAANGSGDAKTAANAKILALRELDRKAGATNVLHPNLAPLRQQVADAQAQEKAAADAIVARRDTAKDQMKTATARLQAIAYGIPNLSRVSPRHGSRLDTVIKNFNTMARSIDTVMSKDGMTIGGVGSLEKNKEAGMLKENADILKELAAPVALDQVPPQSLAVLPYYPRLLASVADTDSDAVRTIDAARGSLALFDKGLTDLDAFVKQLARSQLDMSGDINTFDYKTLEPLMTTATESLGKAAVAAAQSEQIYDLGRARQLQERITMLGLTYPNDRYDTLVKALDTRLHNNAIDYATMVKNDLSPGDVAAASIVAADTNATPISIVNEAKATHRSIVDVANSRGMHAKSLEMFLGLVYLSYMDDPDKEAMGRT